MASLEFTTAHRQSLWSRFSAWFAEAVASYAHARARTPEFEYYNALSDEQLAAKGLRREDIARHIFRDMIY